MSRNSPSNTTTDHPRPWLQTLYQTKRQRTVDLVKAAVDCLQREGQPVTIDAICRVSKELDPQGKGIKKAGILGNPEAHAYYSEHSRSSQIAQRRKHGTSYKGRVSRQPSRIAVNRDADRVRQRYLQQSKVTLVERLVAIEQAYAVVQQQLACLQFELIETQQKWEKEMQHERQPQ